LRVKILKKLRTASLNSEFTGSYKKSVSLSLCLLKIIHETGMSYTVQFFLSIFITIILQFSTLA